MRKFLIIATFLMLLSCTQEEVRLNTTERALVDSLYNKELTVWRTAWIDSCQNLRDAKLDSLVDSVMAVRIEEIKYLIQKNE